MPAYEAMLTRQEVSAELSARGFRYSASTLASFHVSGEGPPTTNTGRRQRDKPRLFYHWGLALQWALKREIRLRPGNELTIKRGRKELVGHLSCPSTQRRTA